MNKTRGSPQQFVLILLLGTVALSNAYGFGPWLRWESGPSSSSSSSSSIRGGTGGRSSSNELCSRASFLHSVAVGGAACLVGAPSMAVARTDPAPPSDTAAKLQAGFDSFNREAKNIDRVLTKEGKVINRAVTQKTKKVTKEIRNSKEVKKVTKETKNVMRKVDKETKAVKKEAKKIGSTVDKETKAFIGGVLPPKTKAGVGIDVSKVKVCRDSTKKCL
jgi:hypothetical protein